MCTLGISYPQHWLTGTFEAADPRHAATLRTIYGTTKKLWLPMDTKIENVEKWVPPPLDICYFKLQRSCSKIIVILNAQVAMPLPMTKNPMSQLWCKLSSNALISSKHSNFMKVVDIAYVQMWVSVDDEWTFNSLLFLKIKNDHKNLRFYNK